MSVHVIPHLCGPYQVSCHMHGLKLFFAVFVASFALIAYGLRQSFIPSDQFDTVLAYGSVLLASNIFCYFTFIFRQQDPKWPWGWKYSKKYVKNLWKNRQIKDLALIVVSLPLSVAILSYLFVMIGIASGALISRETAATSITARAECVSASRGKLLGIANEVHLEGGRYATIRGLGQVCSSWYSTKGKEPAEFIQMFGRESWFGIFVDSVERTADATLRPNVTGSR